MIRCDNLAGGDILWSCCSGCVEGCKAARKRRETHCGKAFKSLSDHKRFELTETIEYPLVVVWFAGGFSQWRRTLSID